MGITKRKEGHMYKNVLGLCLVILCLAMVSLAYAGNGKVNPYKTGGGPVELTVAEQAAVEPEGKIAYDSFRAFIFWLSPGILLVGIFYLFGNYRKLETTCDREMGIHKRIFPKLESNIYVVNHWALHRHIVVGLMCVLCAILFYMYFR